MVATIVNTSFPCIAPSAIAIGAGYTHLTTFLLSRPVLGPAFQKVKTCTRPEEFAKSREAANSLIFLGSSLVGSGVQSYAVSALLKLTGVASYKAAAIVGALLFAVTTGPAVIADLTVTKTAPEQLFAQAVTSLLDTVGLALVLTWWHDPQVGLR